MTAFYLFVDLLDCCDGVGGDMKGGNEGLVEGFWSNSFFLQKIRTLLN